MSDLHRLRRAMVFVAAVLWTGVIHADDPVVRYDDGRLTLQCSQTPLEKVLEKIQGVTGVEFLLEDTVRSLSINARLDQRPLRDAMEAMLEGTGASYVMVFAPEDHEKITKVYVGTGDPASIVEKAEARARSAPDARRTPTPDPGGETASESPALDPDEPVEAPPVEGNPDERPDLAEGQDMKPPLAENPENTPAVDSPTESPAVEGSPSSTTTTAVDPSRRVPRKPKKKR